MPVVSKARRSTTSTTLAALIEGQERFEEVEGLYRRAPALKKKLLGRAHPDVAMTLDNLGVLTGSAGRSGEARRFSRRAVGIFERGLDAGHPEITRCKDNLAALDGTPG